jgi:hypothetical protein
LSEKSQPITTLHAIDSSTRTSLQINSQLGYRAGASFLKHHHKKIEKLPIRQKQFTCFLDVVMLSELLVCGTPASLGVFSWGVKLDTDTSVRSNAIICLPSNELSGINKQAAVQRKGGQRMMTKEEEWRNDSHDASALSKALIYVLYSLLQL